jgi:hypothetical protein
MPTRVSIYVKGPGIYIDKSDTPASLSKQTPACMLTNSTVISNLVSVISQEEDEARIPNITTRRGLTYHLLFFQDANMTVMQFRVFQPTEFKTLLCEVYPRSSSKFGYFNGKIGSWLHSHLTNDSPSIEVQLDTTNASDSAPGHRRD